jgi:imidazolonepropionase-like amidohydrolase
VSDRQWISALVLTLAMAMQAALAAPAAGEEAAGGKKAAAVTVLHAARMVDIELGKLRSDVTVVIEGERILSVSAGEDEAAAPPPGARVLDLGDVTLLPGLIDLHTHLTYDSGNLLPKLGRHPQTAAATHAIVGARNAATTLRAGFTTVRDLGACCFADVTLAQAIDAGLTEGPRIVPSSYVLTIFEGSCDQTIAEPRVFDGGPRQGIVNGPQEIVEAIRYLAGYGAKVIKACVDRQQFTADEIRVMATEAHRRGLKLATHIGEPDSIRAALEGGADTIEHVGILDDELIQLFLDTGTVLVPTIYVTEDLDLSRLPPRIQERLGREIPQFQDSLRRAIRAGVKIAFGSDTGEMAHGDNALEAMALVRYGMTPAAVLRAATLDAAAVLDVDDRGTLEGGKLADLIAVAGNPLEDIATLRQVRFVMKGGAVYKDETAGAPAEP